MPWLIIAILTYFLLAIVSLVDKYLLGGLMPSPKIYAFYMAALGILVLVLVPFGFLLIPRPWQIFLALLVGIFHILGILIYFHGLKKFESSRIVPAIGGFSPLFTFGLTYFFQGGKEILSFKEIIAFLLLILGGVLIVWKKSANITLKSLQYSVLASFFFSLYYVLAKFIYLEQSFISGFIWTRIGAFLVAILLLFSKEVREELFVKRESFKIKTWGIFLPNEAGAAGAFILQNWAIALAGVGYVAIISALQGVQYIFLLILAILLSFKFPQILKEEISREIIFQKIIAILIISVGLSLLVLK